MAEVGDGDVEDVRQKTLRELHAQFFEMVPIRRMKWKVNSLLFAPMLATVVAQTATNARTGCGSTIRIPQTDQ